MAKYKIEYKEQDGIWRETSYSAPDSHYTSEQYLIDFFGLDECLDYKITKVG